MQYDVFAVKVQTKIMKMLAKDVCYNRFKGEEHRQMCAYVQFWTESARLYLLEGRRKQKGFDTRSISVGLRYSNKERVVRQYQGDRIGQEVNVCRHFNSYLSVCRLVVIMTQVSVVGAVRDITLTGTHTQT